MLACESPTSRRPTGSFQGAPAAVDGDEPAGTDGLADGAVEAARPMARRWPRPARRSDPAARTPGGRPAMSLFEAALSRAVDDRTRAINRAPPASRPRRRERAR